MGHHHAGTARNFRCHTAIWLITLVSPACHAFGQTLTTLHSFRATPNDGQAPASGVIVDDKGNLFGTTGGGGGNASNGTVFELTPPQVSGGVWTETILHKFQGMPDGRIPLSRLAMSPDGSLFGTTLRGGVNDLGTAYTLAPKKNGDRDNETPIYSFGSVAFDVLTPDLGFSFAPQRLPEDRDHIFAARRDGKDPEDGEILYAADQGGANGTGVVYTLAPPKKGSNWTETILYNFGPFQSGDGADPGGELVRDAQGNLYGVTAQGGVNNLGAVYELSPPARPAGPWTEKILFSFSLADGTIPSGPLLLGAQGQLYGTTVANGPSQSGDVFELSPPRLAGHPWTLTIVYAFTGGVDGGSPENGVIADAQGNLYGTASDVVFKLTPPRTSTGMWTETVLHTFTGPDGFTTSGALTLFNNALYGTTSQAGAFGAGTAYQLTLP